MVRVDLVVLHVTLYHTAHVSLACHGKTLAPMDRQKWIPDCNANVRSTGVSAPLPFHVEYYLCPLTAKMVNCPSVHLQQIGGRQARLDAQISALENNNLIENNRDQGTSRLADQISFVEPRSWPCFRPTE